MGVGSLGTTAPLSEKQWQQRVVDFARLKRWKVYHTLDSRGSAAGFPDLVLVRAPRLIFAELKTDRAKSVATPAQVAWLTELAECMPGNPHLEVCVWRPADWSDVRRILH
jgi:hypothetical protein